MVKKYKYEVALSFAGEDRPYVERVASTLKELDVKVFYDHFFKADLWGEDLFQYLSKIYKDESKFTLIFISKHYVLKDWTLHELKQAQARELQQKSGYILPVRLDNTEIPGVLPTTGYIDVANMDAEELAAIIVEKLGKRKKPHKSIIEPTEIELIHPHVKLLIESRNNWLNYGLLPEVGTLAFLLENIWPEELSANEIAFLWCAAKIKSKDLDEWSKNNSPVYYDHFFRETAKFSNNAEPLVSEDAKYIVKVLEDGQDWQITYPKYLAASLIIKSETSKSFLYSFVRDSEGEGVEVLIEANYNFPVKIRHVTSDARNEFDRASLILENNQKG